MAFNCIIRLVDPASIKPRNNLDQKKLMQLVTSLWNTGWVGIPIYIEKGSDDFQWKAVTGSHRIAAAMAVGLQVIPCRLYDRTTDSLESEGAD